MPPPYNAENVGSLQCKQFLLRPYLAVSPPLRALLADLSVIHDPSIDDPMITGERDRVLSVGELQCILPHLMVTETTSPEWWKVDLRPIAQRFMLLTLARREEVESARRADVNLKERTWTKRVKGGHRVTHPMSDAAIALLEALPGFDCRVNENRDSETAFLLARAGGARTIRCCCLGTALCRQHVRHRPR